MSLIWSISKDVLTATWSMPPKRIMGIALRLSLVVGVVGGLVRFYQMHMRYDAAVMDAARIHVALQCAQRRSDETLLQHANQYGNIDISKVFCADRTFLASMKEIRGVPAGFRVPDYIRYRSYVQPEMVVGEGFGWMLSVNILGALLIGLRYLAMWIIGR